MTRVRALIIGCIGAFAFVASAHAADPARSWRRPLPEPEYEKPEPRYRELMSGWYLRGDLGYRWNSVGSVSSSTPTTGEKYGNAVAGTLGFGYKYRWFRVDLTVDHAAPSRISATTAAAGTAQPQHSAKVGSTSVMANLYVDFGTWAGFTPYIGGGVGETQLKSANYTDTAVPATTVFRPGKAINFSWAWMAGVAFQVRPNWMIDVGFRHLQLGDVPSSEGAGTISNAAVFKNLSANEARFGVRYLFD